MSLRNAQAVLVSVLISGPVFSADYAEMVRKGLEKAFSKKDFPGYQFSGSPTANFGVGTIFDGSVTDPKKPATGSWLIAEPSTWWAPTMYGQIPDEEAKKKTERDTLLNQIIVAGPLGAITVQEDLARHLGATTTSALLQKLLTVSISYSHGSSTSIKGTRVVNRLINWTVFMDAVRTGKLKTTIREQIEREDRNLVIVAGDIVVEGYAIVLDTNPQKDKELNKTLLSVSVAKAGKDPIFKITADQTHNGRYEVTSSQPVIIARLILRPPDGYRTTFAPVTDWAIEYKRWRLVTVPIRVFDRLEVLR